MAMRICWRCGIKFDPSEYTRDAPCYDCQDVLEIIEKSKTPWRRVRSVTPEIRAAREADIRYFLARGLSDTAIAKRCATSGSAITKLRNDMGIKGNNEPGQTNQWGKSWASVPRDYVETLDI